MPYQTEITVLKKSLTSNHWLPMLESRYSFSEFERLLSLHPIKQAITLFLADRWERIAGTDLMYSLNPIEPLNAFCIELAKSISSQPHSLLMPTVKSMNPVTRIDINDHQLVDIFLRDDPTQYLDIMSGIEFFEELNLSETELSRLKNHSDEAKALYKAIYELKTLQKKGTSIGSHIEILIQRLRDGGQNGGNGGSDDLAAHDANVGIVNFKMYIETLSRTDKRKLFGAQLDVATHFGHIWHRLITPIVKEGDDKLDTIYCVEVNATDLSLLLRHNPHLYNNEKRNTTEKLSENICYAQTELALSLQSPKKVFSTHGVLSQDRLATRLLDDAFLPSLSDDIKTTIMSVFQDTSFRHFFQELSLLPEAMRFNFIKLFTPTSFRSQFACEAYSLGTIIGLIGSEHRAALLTWLGKKNLQLIIADKFQLAEMVLSLSSPDMNSLITLLSKEFIENKISSSYELRMLLNKVSLNDWYKLQGLVIFIPKPMRELLLNDLDKLCNNSYEKSSCSSPWAFILLLGIEQAGSLIETPQQFSCIMKLLTVSQQLLMLEHVNFKRVFMGNDAKNKAELKTQVKNVILLVDEFNSVPHIRDTILLHTLKTYAEDRVKFSYFGMYSKKTKAICSLSNALANNVGVGTLSLFKKEFKQNNEVGQFHKHLKAYF